MAFNKKHFSDLKAVLNEYKTNIDAILKGSRVDEKLKEVYSPEYFQRVKDAALANAKKSMDEKRTATQTRVNSIVKALRDDVASWVNAPVDANLLSRLSAIKTSGVKLSRADFELLIQESAGQYLPTKILSEMAAESGFSIKAPDAERYIKEIDSIERGSKTLLNGYAGQNAEGADMLPDNMIGGVSYGRLPSWQSVMADSILKPSGVLDEAESHWGDTMAKIETKDTLSAAEAERLDGYYKGHEGDVANRTKELLSINPGLKDLLQLSEYAEFLPSEE